MIEVVFKIRWMNMKVKNNYFGSPYAHWDYSLFEDFKPYRIDGKKRGFLSSLNGVRYIQESNMLLLLKLVDYYKDLNVNLERLLDNYYDEMFMRYAFRAKVFGSEQRFEEFLQIWDDVFSYALEMYVNKYHSEYDETFGISYVSYFNMKFSACLLFQTTEVLKKFNNKSGYEEGFKACRDVEVVLFSQNIKVEIPLEYPLESFHQELLYQSFSPSERSIA